MDRSGVTKRAGPVRGRARLGEGWPWIGLASWFVVLFAADAALASREQGGPGIGLAFSAVFGTLAVISLVALVRVVTSARELRRLGVLAVVLPSLFAVGLELSLYFVEDGRLSEPAEHLVTAAVISVGAVPFCVYLFRAFARIREELARRARRLRILHEASMSVTAETSPARIGSRIAESAMGALGATRGICFISGRWGAGEIVTVFPAATPGPEVTQAEEGFIHAIMEAAGAGRPGGGSELIGVPLRGGGQAVGAVVLGRDAGPEFTREDVLMLDMFSLAASAALENAGRLEEAQLVSMAEERERIARELHDELGQLLGYITAKTQAAREYLAAGRQARAGAELTDLELAARGLSGQVREAILGLRARAGPGKPLGEALEEYVKEFSLQAGILAEFRGSPKAGGDLPGWEQYHLLRIAQEALSNARKHAGARRVAVSLTRSADHLELSVIDDGRGFDPAKCRPGFGLRTMRERAEALGGTLEMASSPGSGSVIRVGVPAPGG